MRNSNGVWQPTAAVEAFPDVLAALWGTTAEYAGIMFWTWMSYLKLGWNRTPSN